MPRSVVTIDKPEFINISPTIENPLISKCEIKVMYVGSNRNRSHITKDVAAEIAQTLPGCPIVGYFKEEKDDFTDHGQQVIIDDEGVHFNTLTTPYGFVAPDARPWFQKFEDKDEFDNVITHEYLMANGYLWTGQFPEAQKIIDEGRPQSMEFDTESLQGKWAVDPNSGIEFFIINDAIFSKLAILGEDVEPCFEGASVTAPKVSASFSLDNEFKHTLFSMMQDLQNALEPREGGLNNMIKEELLSSGKKYSEFDAEERALFSLDEQADMEAAEAEEVRLAEEETARVAAEEAAAEEAAALEAAAAEEPPVEVAEPTLEERFALLEQSQKELTEKYELLETEAVGLREFKVTAENIQKDALIAEFYMLSDDDKADVIANKANYSLAEIESKLAVVCFKNKVTFDRKEEPAPGDGDGEPAVTFTLESTVETVPGFVAALRNVRDNDN